jgi:signal transduction histidine kinase
MLGDGLPVGSSPSAMSATNDTNPGRVDARLLTIPPTLPDVERATAIIAAACRRETAVVDPDALDGAEPAVLIIGDDPVHLAAAAAIRQSPDRLAAVLAVVPSGPAKAAAADVTLDPTADNFPVRLAWTVGRLTAQAETGAELTALRDTARRIDEDLERTLYVLSHDLRAPLISLSGYAELLREDIRDGKPDAADEDLREIGEGVQRMSNQLAGVLALSRARRMPLSQMTLDVRELLDTSVKAWRDGKPGAELAVEISAPPGLMISADATRVMDVIGRLLDNAVAFAQDDLGRPPRAAITAEPAPAADGDGVFIRLADPDGIGMSPAQLDRAFELFWRADPSAGRNGVGLPIARRLIEAHPGGRLTLAAPESGGLVAELLLPGAAGADADA